MTRWKRELGKHLQQLGAWYLSGSRMPMPESSQLLRLAGMEEQWREKTVTETLRTRRPVLLWIMAMHRRDRSIASWWLVYRQCVVSDKPMLP